MPGTAFCLDLHTENNDEVRTWECSPDSSHQRFTFRTL